MVTVGEGVIEVMDKIKDKSQQKLLAKKGETLSEGWVYIYSDQPQQ